MAATMKTRRNSNLLFNWIFIPGLLFLALNDHVLKWQYSNWLTGKLSDFTGLLILPMFVQFIFPKLKISTIVCGLLFIFWKLPVSDGFIQAYNRFAIVPVVRTIDYTDLLALTVLPVSHFLIKDIDKFAIFHSCRQTATALFVLVPASFIFMATSPPISYYMKPGGDIHIGKYYKMKKSKEQILDNLKEEGFSVRRDTLSTDHSMPQYYFIENVVLGNEKDTIKSIEIAFMGNRLLVNNISLKGEFKISDWRALKRYSRYYKKLIKAGIIEEMR